jgi:membrane fusion protein, multidrug efflux system
MDQRTDRKDRRESDDAAVNSKLRKSGHSWIDILRERRGLILPATASIVIALGRLVIWWVTASGYVSTDDAFIDARTVTISSQINAAVVDVQVTDNQLVGPGVVLLRLDDRDYSAQVNQAKAVLSQAKANIIHSDAQISVQQARIDQAEKQAAQTQAMLTFARQQNTRYQGLVRSGAGTVEQAEQYTSNFLQAQAAFAAAQANAVVTKKQLAILHAVRSQGAAQLQEAAAGLEQAEVNLSHTIITAPVAGRVTQLTAEGEYAAAGQALMMFVPNHIWVTANFKETELNDIRPGEPVGIEVDAYPKHTFKGHVASIQAGSAAVFSLLPPENATGNYVKIVQRVPVKIVFNRAPDVLLGPGMSVVPTVKVG